MESEEAKKRGSEEGKNAKGGATGLKFARKSRLTLAKEYAAVYEAKARKGRGPLTVYAMPNGLGYARLGLAISRKVGSAVVRVRVKRMLREAFRHEQHGMPRGARGSYDLVVNARAHDNGTLVEYRDWLMGSVAALHKEWEKRAEAKRGA